MASRPTNHTWVTIETRGWLRRRRSADVDFDRSALSRFRPLPMSLPLSHRIELASYSHSTTFLNSCYIYSHRAYGPSCPALIIPPPSLDSRLFGHQSRLLRELPAPSPQNTFSRVSPARCLSLDDSTIQTPNHGAKRGFSQLGYVPQTHQAGPIADRRLQ